jgi:two-component system, cell cycle response regulator
MGGEHPLSDKSKDYAPGRGNTTDPLSETTRLALRKMRLPDGGAHPQLVIIEGASVGSLISVGDVPVTLGREPSNFVVLNTVGVSRRHAVVRKEGEDITIEDLGSKNGTFVNREPINKLILNDGDLVFIGAATLKFLSAENVERTYYDHLHEVSAQDSLTGLPNRRYFDDFLTREVARYHPTDGGLALLVIDVDHFKRVNDSLGHLAGDYILRELSKVMSAGLRRSDFLARYGGEEFALVLPGTPREIAAVIASKLRMKVEKYEFRYNEHLVPVTISVGVAMWSVQMSGHEEFIKLADEQMYRAKNAGRNQVVLDQAAV